MRVLLCDTDDCQVVAFTETDQGTTRCPSCGFLGERLRDAQLTNRAGVRQLVRRLLWRPTPAGAALR